MEGKHMSFVPDPRSRSGQELIYSQLQKLKKSLVKAKPKIDTTIPTSTRGVRSSICPHTGRRLHRPPSSRGQATEYELEFVKKTLDTVSRSTVPLKVDAAEPNSMQYKHICRTQRDLKKRKELYEHENHVLHMVRRINEFSLESEQRKNEWDTRYHPVHERPKTSTDFRTLEEYIQHRRAQFSEESSNRKKKARAPSTRRSGKRYNMYPEPAYYEKRVRGVSARLSGTSRSVADPQAITTQLHYLDLVEEADTLLNETRQQKTCTFYSDAEEVAEEYDDADHPE